MLLPPCLGEQEAGIKSPLAGTFSAVPGLAKSKVIIRFFKWPWVKKETFDLVYFLLPIGFLRHPILTGPTPK